MKRLKRWAVFALLAALCLLFSGCGQTKTAAEDPQDAVFSVYASFYPIYALAQPLVEGVDGVELHCLAQPQDGCLRSYTLSDWDFALLTGAADALIIGGNGLESYESTVYALGENGPAVISLLTDMNLLTRYAVNADDDRTTHWSDSNPHIYMCADGALEIAKRIEASLALLDPDHASAYAENLKHIEEKLHAIQADITESLASVNGKKAIVMNEALVYADSAYGLSVDLCYERESGEDISGADLEKCLETLKNSGAEVILIEKQAPQHLCKALETTGYTLAKLDILSTRRAAEGFDGYLAAQNANVQALLTAFASAK